jgi:hypothetical protein
MESSSTSTSASASNPAVQRCIEAGSKAYELRLAKDGDESKAQCDFRDAYRNAMPHLAGARNIQDFIACVTYGILHGLFYASETPRLLYAAQVALAAVPREPAQKKEPKAAVPSGRKPTESHQPGATTSGETKAA